METTAARLASIPEHRTLNTWVVKKMKCAIHQPQFLPWLGYLHKIYNVDRFIFLDNVQFRKNEFQNRNRLLIAGEARWLTVPVSFKFGATLRETKIAADVTWRKKMMRTIALNYAHSPCFQQFRESLAGVIEQDWDNIAELNLATVRWLMKCFDIRTEVSIASQLLKLSADPNQRLLALCRRVGADTYLSGAGGRNYLKPVEFEKGGIKLEFQEFPHPVYPQHSPSQKGGPRAPSRGHSVATERDAHLEHSVATERDAHLRRPKEVADFVSCLSAIDGLFNCGGGAAGRKLLNIEMN